MKVFLAGYEGSKPLLNASAFLTRKYLPGFSVWYLNFGLHTLGNYIELDTHQRGGINSWGETLANFFEKVPDERLIFALDDYLLAGTIHDPSYGLLLDSLDYSVACARLCTSDFYTDAECTRFAGVVSLNKTASYSVTTQYCIWDRLFLIELLRLTRTPWLFETMGSRHLNDSGRRTIGTVTPCLDYPVNSALSARWPGQVKVAGNKKSDIEDLILLGYLDKNQLLYV